MSATYPTCPKCGEHEFEMSVYQLINVEFYGDDGHQVTDGPRGDMEFDGKTFAICAGCRHHGLLEEMVQGLLPRGPWCCEERKQNPEHVCPSCADGPC